MIHLTYNFEDLPTIIKDQWKNIEMSRDIQHMWLKICEKTIKNYTPVYYVKETEGIIDFIVVGNLIRKLDCLHFIQNDDVVQKIIEKRKLDNDYYKYDVLFIGGPMSMEAGTYFSENVDYNDVFQEFQQNIFDSKIAQKGINCSSTAIGSSFCWSASCNVMSKLLWSDGRAFFKIFAQINFLIGVRRTWNRSLTIRNWDYAMRSDTMTALFLVIGRVKIYGTKIFIVSNKIIWFELNRSIVQINNWSKGFAYFLNIFNFFDSNTFFDINTTKNPKNFRKKFLQFIGLSFFIESKKPSKAFTQRPKGIRNISNKILFFRMIGWHLWRIFRNRWFFEWWFLLFNWHILKIIFLILAQKFCFVKKEYGFYVSHFLKK